FRASAGRQLMRRGVGLCLGSAMCCMACAVYTPDLVKGSTSDGAGGQPVGPGGAGGQNAGGAGVAGAGGTNEAGGDGTGGTLVLDAGADDGPSSETTFEDRTVDASDASDVGRDGVAEASTDAGCPSSCILKAGLAHRYSFSGTGVVVTDSVGQADGTLIHTQLTGTGKLVLAGGTTDQYVDLPNGLVRSLTNATFEAWATWNGGAGWQRLFDFGNSNAAEGTQGVAVTTFYLTPQGGGPTVLLAAFKRQDQMGVNET